MLSIMFWIVAGPIVVIAVAAAWLWLLTVVVKAVFG